MKKNHKKKEKAMPRYFKEKTAHPILLSTPFLKNSCLTLAHTSVALYFLYRIHFLRLTQEFHFLSGV